MCGGQWEHRDTTCPLISWSDGGDGDEAGHAKASSFVRCTLVGVHFGGMLCAGLGWATKVPYWR